MSFLFQYFRGTYNCVCHAHEFEVNFVELFGECLSTFFVISPNWYLNLGMKQVYDKYLCLFVFICGIYVKSKLLKMLFVFLC